MRVRHIVLCASFLTCFVLYAGATLANPLAFNGTSDFMRDDLGYYYAITGGRTSENQDGINGDNASGGTFRYIHDDAVSWNRTKGYQQWARDDWFTTNAGLALTLKGNGSILYDNNGIETNNGDGFYDYGALPEGSPSSSYSGLYRGYSMPNNWDWIYSGYFDIESDLTIDEIVGYFDPTAGFDPDSPFFRYGMNIWGAQLDAGVSATTYMPTSNSFIGDIFSSHYVGGAFSWSDTGVDRVLPAWLIKQPNPLYDDIWRLSYRLDNPITLTAGRYFFSHSAEVVPEPGTLVLLGLGLGVAGLVRRRSRRQ